MASPIVTPDDPMVQKVLAQQQAEARTHALVEQMRLTFAVSYMASHIDEVELSLESGRDLAEKALQQAASWTPFLLEQMGIVKIESDSVSSS